MKHQLSDSPLANIVKPFVHLNIQEHSRVSTISFSTFSIKISPGDIDEKSSDVEDMPLQLQSDTVPIRRISEQRIVKVYIYLFKWSYVELFARNIPPIPNLESQ